MAYVFILIIPTVSSGDFYLSAFICPSNLISLPDTEMHVLKVRSVRGEEER